MPPSLPAALQLARATLRAPTPGACPAARIPAGSYRCCHRTPGGLASPRTQAYRAARLVLGRCLVRGTRPNRRHCSPAVAPRGDRGCGPHWPGSTAGCSLLAAPARDPATARRRGRGWGNSWQLQVPAPELQLQPRASRLPRVRASEANLPPPLPMSMPSAAVGESERPGPGQRSVAEGSGDGPQARSPGDKWRKARGRRSARARRRVMRSL